MSRLCVACRWFNGFNGRDLCLWHQTADPVRGVSVAPRLAAYERSKWVLVPGGERCKPDGIHWEPVDLGTPPKPTR